MTTRKGSSLCIQHLQTEYPEFEQHMEGLTERQQFIIRERLKGRTLEDVGRYCPRSALVGGGTGITKDRVRQLEWKACRTLENMCIRARRMDQ